MMSEPESDEVTKKTIVSVIPAQESSIVNGSTSNILKSTSSGLYASTVSVTPV